MYAQIYTHSKLFSVTRHPGSTRPARQLGLLQPLDLGEMVNGPDVPRTRPQRPSDDRLKKP